MPLLGIDLKLFWLILKLDNFPAVSSLLDKIRLADDETYKNAMESS